jgi:hypothetical protein
MRLLVYMRDGRTVYALSGRAVLGRLMRRDPAHEEESIAVVRGIWNPLTGEYLWTRGIRLRFIAQHSIAFVEEGTPNEAKTP